MAETATAIGPKSDGKKKKAAHPRDPFREAIETIVFVVVLVLLLKLFVTEAFVIPTGSMAETLYGYQKIITCPKCGHEFPVNSHDEVEPNQSTNRRHLLVGFTCPNCRYPGHVAELNPVPTNNTGDRVLVLKPIYHAKEPDRGDVVVFKYPEKPQENHTAQNYIKRAQGFGGETMAIHRGDLYATRSLDYPADARDESGDPLYPRPDDPNDLWRPAYTYSHPPANRRAAELFEASRKTNFSGEVVGGFEIVRKPPAQLLADLRIVWDNDQQPKELAARNVPTRWHDPLGQDQKPWVKFSPDDPRLPRAFAHSGDGLDWIRYRHSIYPWAMGDLAEMKPRPIDNFLGYNAGIDLDPLTRMESGRPNTADGLWVGDLALECEAELGAGGEIVMELSKGQNRFQAVFGGGRVAIASTGPGSREFGSRPCKVRDSGKYRLRFANVDARLRVWVNDHLVDFGTDGDYPPGSTIAPDKADGEGYTEENDVAAPASIGAKGTVTIRGIKLHRDIYYTRNPGDNSRADLYYVHPGHYLCLGDNSAQSSDGRKWGLVPERLLLGKAVFVFWPFWMDAAKNRVGLIK